MADYIPRPLREKDFWSITDNYPKYVVSMDEMNETGTYEGIKRLQIRDFCMNILLTNYETRKNDY